MGNIEAPKPTVSDYVLSYLAEGRFAALTPVQRVVFAFAHVCETKCTLEEIARFFDPPKTTKTIAKHMREGLIKLDGFGQQINPYDLSNRTYNALYRGWARNIPWDRLNDMSDEELLNPPKGRFGVKALQEVREKFALHSPNSEETSDSV